MRFEMKMPDLSATESEVRILRWLASPGQAIQRGQPLLEVETDKATTEVESAVSGVLQEVRLGENEVVSAGQVIAVLEVEGTVPVAFSANPAPHSLRNPFQASPPATATTSVSVAAGGVGMFARNRAAATAVGNARGGVTELTAAQRFTAKRLQESKRTIPHFYLQASANASAMIARRKAAEPAMLAWDALVVLAVAKAMVTFDRFGYRLDGERLLPIESDAIGVAMDNGNELYVIPVASPGTKTAEQISEEIRHRVQRIRNGESEARRMERTLMTVSNLGICKIESVVPIINPPEAAVLGLGRVAPVPVAKEDGSIGVEPRCTLTLSVDHRIASGRYAGDFLAAIVRELETT